MNKFTWFCIGFVFGAAAYRWRVRVWGFTLNLIAWVSDKINRK